MRVENSILVISASATPDPALNQIIIEKGFIPYNLAFDTVTVNRLPTQMPKCIIMGLNQYNVEYADILERVHAAYPGFNIPVLALVSSIPPFEIEEFDSVLLQPCHPAQIFMRASSLIRLAEMEREIGLRFETLDQDFGLKTELPMQDKREKLSILFIGKASPQFMVIINALQKHNVQIVAAFTSFTAFDYLYEKNFDAVVMNGLESTEPAYTLADTMRKNASLFHVPALLLVDDRTFTDRDKAYEHGMSDIIDAQANVDEIRTRLMEQANFHRTHQNLKYTFGGLGDSSCLDASTGLYNSSFFNTHLKRLNAYYGDRNLPITLCLIRIKYENSELAEKSLKSAYQQVAGIIKSLLRLQDLVGRLDTSVFSVAFPGQTPDQLSSVTNRIMSILECAAITDPFTNEALKIKLEVSLNTLNNIDLEHSAA
jgi:two-component system cell cycle response regulator PopA